MKPVWEDARVARGTKRQLDDRRSRIAAGSVPLGWKVGFGAPAAMEKFKLTGPLIGFLLREGELLSGAKVSLASWTKPVAEPEIAIHIGRDVPAGGSLREAAEAISALSPAIELADVTLPFDDPEAILGANIFQRHVIVGARDMSRAGGSTTGLVGRVLRNGAETARTDDPEALTGNLIYIVRHVADLLAAFDERLTAGEVIIAGSIVPPIFLSLGDDRLEFVLDAIGSVGVLFTR